MGEHALLGPSGAHRWLNCTPSARLEQQFPESTSDYAEEGSLAHEICELKLRKHFIDPMGPRIFKNKLKKLQENRLYQDEMLRHTDTYLNHIQGLVHGYASPPYITVERKLSYSKYVPEGFGTADCIIIGGNVMHVIDFKYGQGVPVSAHKNPQMMLYAVGAILEYSMLYNIEQIVMVIIQPRLNSITEFIMSADDLLYWVTNSVMGLAERAWKGEGEYLSGEHCKFCRANSLCRARAEFNTSLEEYGYRKPPLLTNDEVGEILEKAQDLAKWAADIEKYALAEILKGTEIPGWKAVAGRGSRKFINIDEAFKHLISNGYDEALLYNREPLTAPKIEEVLGKAKYDELLTAHVIKSPGKPTLAPASDTREAFQQYDLKELFKSEIRGNEISPLIPQ